MKTCEKACSIALAWVVGSAVAAEPKISVVFPAAGACVQTEKRTYVIGSVTPSDAPLTVNSQTVTPWRTGGFLYMAAVAPGTNTLVFRAGKTELAHTFTVPYPAPPWDRKSIRVLQPQHPLGVHTNEAIRLECLAPAGLAVCAAVGERTLTLSPQEGTPSRYSGSVAFPHPVENVPVTFFADGFPDAVAAPLTARGTWPACVVTGGLFEVRARSLPNEGETVGFLPPGLHIRTGGFIGTSTGFWLANRLRYVETRYLATAPAASELPSRDLPIPDLAAGFGPHPPTNRTPSQVLIVLDPGHGNTSTGALGPTGYTEKEANLAQAKVVQSVLTNAGFRVLMTRETDVDPDLYERARLAYQAKADAFISIHHNATPPQADPRNARHVTTYAWNDIGLSLARALHPHIAAVTPIDDRGVSTASFAVCRNPAVPSCLMELDFINCPEGEESIRNAEHQRRVAEAVRDGLLEWLGKP